jgi:hypothetical protein
MGNSERKRSSESVMVLLSEQVKVYLIGCFL